MKGARSAVVLCRDRLPDQLSQRRRAEESPVIDLSALLADLQGQWITTRRETSRLLE
jgi:hypothetical protein